MELHLTNAGQKLLYKAQGGQTLKFTRFGLGDGDLGEQNIENLTSLINEKMVSTLTKIDVRSSKVILGMSFNNSELLEGFYFKELGLFAEDPETSEEILYLYGNSGETSDYIDPKTGRVIEERLDVEIYVSNVNNITATIDDSLAFATQEELDNLKNKVDGITIPTKTSELEKDDVYTKKEVDEAFNSFNDNDILTFTNILIKTTDWVEDSTYEEFGYKADIPLDEVTIDFFPEVVFEISEAVSGNFSPICISGDNYISIFAVKAPEANITIPTIVCSKGG